MQCYHSTSSCSPSLMFHQKATTCPTHAFMLGSAGFGATSTSELPPKSANHSSVDKRVTFQLTARRNGPHTLGLPLRFHWVLLPSPLACVCKKAQVYQGLSSVWVDRSLAVTVTGTVNHGRHLAQLQVLCATGHGHRGEQRPAPRRAQAPHSPPPGQETQANDGETCNTRQHPDGQPGRQLNLCLRICGNTCGLHLSTISRM